ncbi:hypothetical protein PoB_006813600 [Plakobranchus ocellatus]|uniref:Prolactin receptor n=1 Tax=Plakobranchus ocellatus TaxID=259542 RepID=A0AAV4DC35_9GAST|nr:hypothetical protein PoB_006813600 [Plakobranchus ocellatus]
MKPSDQKSHGLKANENFGSEAPWPHRNETFGSEAPWPHRNETFGSEAPWPHRDETFGSEVPWPQSGCNLRIGGAMASKRMQSSDRKRYGLTEMKPLDRKCYGLKADETFGSEALWPQSG